ncbi:MAG: RcnB family protein [Xanthomonadales bacterium]|nr:RcnB family protein [Xanthomonadales bacterium]
MTGHFGDQQRAAIRNYYGEEFRRGHCPPGLAKKHNGCMPPGQVKNWAVGQQLPRDVIFHNLPAQLATQLGQPPAGHRYVRAADDILLITSGTGLVIDAIPGLGLQ